MPARHHRVWIKKIQDIVEGRAKKRKLLIIAPPGHGKSSYTSLVFPPWYLGNHPDHSLLFFTSSDTMANQFGKTVQSTLEGNPEHAWVFPRSACRPDEERGWSQDGLYLQGTPKESKDPAYRAVGYGASVIGARAHGIILDDPLTQEQATSESVQISATAYLDMTVDSRLDPQMGWMIAIMTRWHEKDLAGHLMANPEWEVLNMPSIGYWGPDLALWPDRFPVEFLVQKRTSIGGDLWACIYQNDPTSLGGSVFKERRWFRPLPVDFDEPKEDKITMRQRLRIVQFWDLAFSQKTSADYTAGITIGIDARENVYVLGICRRQVDPLAVEDLMYEEIKRQRPHMVGVELGAYKAGITKDIIAHVERRVRFGLWAIQPETDKVTRALRPAAKAEAGFLFVDMGLPGAEEFIAECIGFPRKEHDDQVDALSGAVKLGLETPLPEKPQQMRISR